MNLKVVAALGLATVSANTCTFTQKFYENNNCGTPATPAATLATKAAVGIGSCVKATFKLVSTGWTPVGTGEADRYIKIDYCGSTATSGVQGGVYWHSYGTDATCTTIETHQPYSGGSATCSNINDIASVSFDPITLVGNSFGLGWGSGISMFFCQTLLFGLICSG